MFLYSAMQDEERPRVGPCLLLWKQRWPCLVSPLAKELPDGEALQEALIVQYLLTKKWGEGVFALLRLLSGLGSPLSSRNFLLHPSTTQDGNSPLSCVKQCMSAFYLLIDGCSYSSLHVYKGFIYFLKLDTEIKCFN